MARCRRTVNDDARKGVCSLDNEDSRTQTPRLSFPLNLFTILKDYLATVRLLYRRRDYQPTVYAPGQFLQADWWDTGLTWWSSRTHRPQRMPSRPAQPPCSSRGVPDKLVHRPRLSLVGQALKARAH